MNSIISNNFYVRTKQLPELTAIEGQIVYIRDVNNSVIKLSMVDNCKPKDDIYSIPISSMDNGWHDVTGLIMNANSVILPKYDTNEFKSEIAMVYRNHITQGLVELKGEDSVGKICFIGTINGNSLTLSKQGYYVVGIDSDYYMLAYSGFCQYLEPWEKPKIQQKILRLVDTNRILLSAKEVVEVCNSLFDEDVIQAQSYINSFNNIVSASISDNNAVSNIYRGGIDNMRLEG